MLLFLRKIFKEREGSHSLGIKSERKEVVPSGESSTFFDSPYMMVLLFV